MAGLAIPLIGAVLPDIITLITGLIHKAAPLAEAANGPSTGPAKFGDVFASVITSLNSAALAGQISKILPSDEVIKIIIQAVVSSMKLGGLLGAPAATVATALPAGMQTLVLKPGAILSISVVAA